MGYKLTEVSKRVKQSMEDPGKKKQFQSAVGIVVFSIFVLSSVVVSRSVQALNQAAGNYGYYSGTYGYNTSTTSSDAPPAASTSLTTSSGTTTSVTLSWTAPTLTTVGTAISTGSGSISSYNIYYGTSSISSCSGSSSTTSTSTSVSLSSLTAGTIYYVGVCAVDNNSNEGSALTGSFTTQSSGGGTSIVTGGGGGTTTGTTYPTGETTSTTGETATVAPVTTDVLSDANTLSSQMGVTRNTTAETTNTTSVNNSATEFGVALTSTQIVQAANFVTYGTSTATQKLGSGERLALVRDALDTLDRFPNSPTTFFEQLATGQKPTDRNLTREVVQLRQVLPMWEKLMGRRPNFKNAKEDLAWNTMMYRVRFTPRDLVKERVGITKFRSVFGRTPTSPLNWAAVRAWGYVLATR